MSCRRKSICLSFPLSFVALMGDFSRLLGPNATHGAGGESPQANRDLARVLLPSVGYPVYAALSGHIADDGRARRPRAGSASVIEPSI
jgi:hypothetical protein